MKNFEVHELVDGWTGQAPTLTKALAMRDEILLWKEDAEVVITAEVDESDLPVKSDQHVSWVTPR